MKKEETTKEWLIIKEGFIGSIITDTYSFGVLAVFIYLNYRYLGNQWAVTWFLLIMFVLLALAKGSDRYHSFTSTKEAIKYLEKL